MASHLRKVRVQLAGWLKSLRTSLGLIRDAQAALDYVFTHPELSKTRIVGEVYLLYRSCRSSGHQVLHGHSLGGAVAIALAHKNPSKVAILNSWSYFI
jgi:alpha-beta hydrolase superfamily lysophospholipase